MIPKDVFVQSAKELREIVWWNEKLTKLSQVADTSQLDDMLVETDGPYIEKVNPPAYYKISNPIPWSDFAYKLKISKEVRDATTTVLFKEENGLPLYHHQGEAISYLCKKTTKREDIVLSVPTATGKTEAFLIPILDYCVTRRKEQQRFEKSQPLYTTKALIIYPMKTLELDQLNRFVEYLYYINKALAEEGWAPIRIGIWDGETPVGVRDFSNRWSEDYDSYGTFVQEKDGARGLKCPIHEEESLIYHDESRLECPKGHYFDWILMTRRGIKNGVDILITNPEALSHLLISSKNKTIVLSNDVKYIVIDEAHTWKGVSGSVFSVFLQRLRSLYEESNPQVVLSSATISRPKQFGQKLLHVSDVRVIRYRTYLDIIDKNKLVKKVDFQRIPHTRFDYSMLVLLGAEYISENEEDLTDYLVKTKHLIPERKLITNSIKMLKLLDLVDTDNGIIKITQRGRQVLDLIKAKAKNLTKNGLQSALQDAVDSLPFIKKWTEIICNEQNGLPEIIYLTENIFGKQRFRKEEDIVAKIKQMGRRIDEKKGREILSTLLSFGRISEIIFDKYHFFLKPISSLFLCVDCKSVNTTNECPKDSTHNQVYPLLFCKKCHTPAIQRSKNELTLVESINDGKCECGKKLYLRNFEGVFLHYGTFTTYLLSVIANKLEPKKILVFGDGRQLVESIANQAQDLDYSLVADRIMCYFILSEGPQTLPKLQQKAGNLLQEIYIKRTPLAVLDSGKQISGLPSSMQSSLDTLRRSYIRKVRYELTEPGNRLFRSAIFTFDAIDKFGDPLEKAFIHVLLSRIVTNLFFSIGEKVGTSWFRTTSVNVIQRQLQQYQGFQCFFENNRFETLLIEVLEEYTGIQKDTKIECGNETKELDKESIILSPYNNNLKIVVPASVSYCENCYEGYPTTELSCCPFCSGELNHGKRFEPSTIGQSVSGKGYLKNKRKNVRWTLDHWAKDILSPAIKWNMHCPNPISDREKLITEQMKYMVVLSHRAGIPQSIRSEIEEGFKRKTPTVNAVCATPTMELGIDIGTLNYMCQVGIPPTKTNYVQRVGRTGRKMTVPSMIFTIIRNKNYVDGHFLTDLSNRFLNREISSIFIPEPSDSILLNHIFMETLQFLNTNQDRIHSQYPDYYRVFPPDESFRKSLASQPVERILDYVIKRVFYALSQDILRNYDEVTSHLAKVFKPFKVDVEKFLNAIFFGKQSLLMRKTIDVFKKLDELYKETLQDRVKSEFVDRNSVLGLFVQNINMFSEFRGIGPSVPIYNTKKLGQLIELKSITYALREGYPGPYSEGKVKKGALWRIEARKFDITKVLVKPPPLLKPDQKIVMCKNATCDNPFETYPSEVEMCPWCNSPLKEVQVYEYRYGEAKPSSSHPWLSRINTRPLFKTQVVSTK